MHLVIKDHFEIHDNMQCKPKLYQIDMGKE